MSIYSTQEIANVLRAIANIDEEAQAAHGAGVDSASYHKGVQSALVSVGLAFGLHQMVSRDRRDGPEWIEMDRGGY